MTKFVANGQMSPDPYSDSYEHLLDDYKYGIEDSKSLFNMDGRIAIHGDFAQNWFLPWVVAIIDLRHTYWLEDYRPSFWWHFK